jgi:hypothetical protein
VNEIVREGSSRDNHIVLIDLSSAEPQSVIVFMNEFKNAIRRDDVLADKELAPLRPAIVSALLRVNAAIPFIGSAYATLKK